MRSPAIVVDAASSTRRGARRPLSRASRRGCRPRRPRVSLAYLPGGAGQDQGRRARAGRRRDAQSGAPGDARYRRRRHDHASRPGNRSDVAEDEADLAAHRAALAALLATAPAHPRWRTPSGCLAERRDLEARLGEAGAQLKASRPMASSGCSARMPTSRRRRHRSALPVGRRRRTSSRRGPTNWRRRSAPAEEELNEAAREERAAREELVGLRTRIAGHAEQIDSYRRARRPRGACQRARARSSPRRPRRKSALNAAVREAPPGARRRRTTRALPR